MRVSAAHIAGIGHSGFERTDSSDATLDDLAISAGTKALLDAGVTYNDVDNSIACFQDERRRVRRSCFDTFGTRGAPVCEVDNQSGLFLAVQCVRSGQSNCTLVIGIDQADSNSKCKHRVSAVAIVLVSSLFLTSHAYLKDAAICIGACSLASRQKSHASSEDPRAAKLVLQRTLRQAQLQPHDIQIVQIQQSPNSNISQALSDFDSNQLQQPSDSLGMTEMAGLCQIVCGLRGWMQDRPITNARHCLQYTVGEDGTISATILYRSDGKVAPPWSEIQNLRDGRERLGYNPAAEERRISHEDLEAVKATPAFNSDSAARQLHLPTRGGDRATLARL